MKKALLFILIASVICQVRATDAWLTDLPAAQAQAKTQNRMVLMDFTGSDWCPGCIELKKHVFNSKVFQDYANTNLVLMKVDFPDMKPNKDQQSDALKKANKDLKETYHVDGFPTLVILGADGKEIAREEGYDDINPQALIDALEKIRSGK